MTERETHEIVEAAQKGDPRAFNSLFARNMPALMAYLRARVSQELQRRESLHDLAQSVCREVLMDIDEFEYRGDKAFRGWLCLRAKRKIVDRYRQYKRAARVESPSGDVRDEAELLADHCLSIDSPSQRAEQEEDLVRVRAAIEKLPTEQRRAVLMSRLEGRSYVQIAEETGATTSSVRGLVARGLAKISDALGGQAR